MRIRIQALILKMHSKFTKTAAKLKMSSLTLDHLIFLKISNKEKSLVVVKEKRVLKVNQIEINAVLNSIMLERKLKI
jgi:hypothetical protein